jgi:hypothetical protein
MEYGLFYYRPGTLTINSIEGLPPWVNDGGRVCITVEESIDEVIHRPDIDIEVVQTIGKQIAFLARPVK